jgi:hypothetical protein
MQVKKYPMVIPILAKLFKTICYMLIRVCQQQSKMTPPTANRHCTEQKPLTKLFSKYFSFIDFLSKV